MAKPASILLIANPENRRARLFLEVAHELGHPTQVLPWIDIIRGKCAIQTPPGSIVRIESPGENPEVELALLKLGETRIRRDAELFPEYRKFASENAIFSVSPETRYEHGRIYPSYQWYLGFMTSVLKLKSELGPEIRFMNPPKQINEMFDKLRCHELFSINRVSVPPCLANAFDFEHVLDAMAKNESPRAFLKPVHSSSASGVVALQTNRAGIRATTSVELTADGTLFNSLRVRTYTSHKEIRAIIDQLCMHRCLLEAWRPKANFQGRQVDLRILVINGEARHIVLRASKSPITNLHLGNKRGDLDVFRAQFEPEAWNEILQTAVKAAACFPDCLYAGVDMLVSPSLRKHAVAEINAFGDLLPNLLHRGENTYRAELLAMAKTT